MSSEDSIFLKEIIGSYTKILYNFIRRFGFTNEETEDILQDVFIKIWKYSDSFDEKKSSYKTWIFTITKNSIYDALRKKRNKSNSLSLDEEDNNGVLYEIEDVTQDIFKILEQSKTHKILLEAIDSLNENEKIIFFLHFEENLTFEEISLILNISSNTVKSKYRRLLFKLKNILEDLHQNLN